MNLKDSILSNLEKRDSEYREIEAVAQSALKTIGLDGSRRCHLVADVHGQTFSVTYYAGTELLQTSGDTVGLNIVFKVESGGEALVVTVFLQTQPLLGIRSLDIEHSGEATSTEQHAQLSSLIKSIGQAEFNIPELAEPEKPFGAGVDKSILSWEPQVEG